MSEVQSTKSGVGRQTKLPFRRAFLISLNSLRIRFWRSIITAGGILLGIAFLTAVLTQWLMQWPVPEKVDAGYVRVTGQVNRPNDFEVWKPIPVSEGLEAGVPEAVVKRVSKGKDAFSLARVLQGTLDAAIDDRKVAKLKSEWKGLARIKDKLAFYVDAAADKDMSVADAVKYGVPRKVARQLAGKAKTFKGGDLAELVREQPRWIDQFYSAAILDQDISIRDGVRAGVPESVARRLAGQGKTFKAGPLNDAIKNHPDQIELWEGRQKLNAIYKTVPQEAIVNLGRQHAITLDEALDLAHRFSQDADQTNVMVVNKGRKIPADFKRGAARASGVRLSDGDNVFVPDINSRYRMIWLVVMALLVCTVGITNSMLMAVTERFKEIGTMKCLGALDRFVVELFMLESGMMGVVASVLGWLVGFVVITLIAGSTRGWDLVANIQGLQVVKTFFISIGAGLLLTTIATIAPALRAAGMPPAVALRSEI